MKVLAIDPGYERLGVAVLEKEKGKKERLIFSDTIQTSPKREFKDRLFEIGLAVEEIIKKYQPENFAIEKLFFNTNQKTATNVSEIRGMLIYLAQKSLMDIYEYTPLEIKVAVTGQGRADKKQVIFMIDRLIDITKEIKFDDEYDAIACGLTFFAYYRENKI